jgi:membrane-bound lytic murein transglycosylase A
VAAARRRRCASGPLRAAAAALLLTGGPAAAPGPARADGDLPRPLGFDALPGWAEDRLSEALPALLASCRAVPAGPGRGRETGPSDEAAGSSWRAACAEAAALADATGADRGGAREAGLRALLERRFRPFALGTGLLTGYYEPLLRGALAPGGPFRTPLRAPPPGLAPDGPRLPDRAAIEDGALDGLALPLLWVDDPADAFFLHIQGSGRVALPGGTVLRLGYAGRNGHPYRAIGRVLVERGALAREAVSMQAIRAWLAAAAPAEAAALLRDNPSYVFFRLLPDLTADQGPVGTLGVPLAPLRSLAVDPAHLPLGAPVWIAARDPVDGAPLRRLVLAQDTGGAIRGPARGDLFWGWGEDAALRAGRMQDRGAAVFVLLPRPAPSAGRAGRLD